MNTSNEEYLQEYITTRGLSKKTHKNMYNITNNYCKFQKLSLHELLLEADEDEEAGLLWKKRRLKKRLVNYMNHLKSTMSISSAKTYFAVIKTFYIHHEIEIGKLPSWNFRNASVQEPITYNDLPDRTIIKKAVEMSKPLMRSIILFLSSTGMSKVDMRKLTIKDFIDATMDYHKSTDIKNALEILNNTTKPIIPIWRKRRSKTNKYFITFNTSECTSEILNYLQSRKNLDPYDILFPIPEHYFTLQFEKINDALNLGYVGAYRRFRGHMLRKFHASNLEKAGMDRYKINVLQGKSNNAVDDVYFFQDEEELKKDYIDCMCGLLIFTEVEKINIETEEVQLIKMENEQLRMEIDEVRRMKEDIEKIKEWYIMD